MSYSQTIAFDFSRSKTLDDHDDCADVALLKLQTCTRLAVADKGYKWVNPNSGDLRVVAKPDPNRQFLGRVSTRTHAVTLVYEDHGSEDGDRVDIFSNQRQISNNVYLTNAPKSTRVNLGYGENVISFRALNQGNSGKNTAGFKVLDANGKTLVSNKEWNLSTGNRAEIIVVRN